MKGYHLDPHPQANVASECFALVTIPRRGRSAHQKTARGGQKLRRAPKNRSRCPQSNVTIMETLEQALARARPEQHLYAARVIGPARSSEGCHIFYLLEIYE